MPRLQLTSNPENCTGILGSTKVDFCKTLIRLEFGNIVTSAFTPVLAKHSKSFSLIDCVLVGVDRMQRNLEPVHRQVEIWQRSELADITAKVVIYEAFVEDNLEARSIWLVRSLLRAEV